MDVLGHLAASFVRVED